VKPTRLRFFLELDAHELEPTLTEDVLSALRRLDAGVTMGLRDLSADRARAVRRMTDAGIPVGAWLLVAREHGYFATIENADVVAARAREVRAWAAREGLAFEALGLDFEPDLRELDLLHSRPVSILHGWARKARNVSAHDAAVERYRTLVRELKAEGATVESYQLPALVEDRRKGRSVLQRLTGSLDVPVDREVVMLYSSLMGPTGAGLVAHWAPHCTAIGLGSTGGGVDSLPKLSWAELERDLLVAAAHASDLSLFSLEGCLQQDVLPRLVDFDWSRPAPSLPVQGPLARGVRAALRTAGRLALGLGS
jgi:hypothetical protein